MGIDHTDHTYHTDHTDHLSDFCHSCDRSLSCRVRRARRMLAIESRANAHYTMPPQEHTTAATSKRSEIEMFEHVPRLLSSLKSGRILNSACCYERARIKEEEARASPARNVRLFYFIFYFKKSQEARYTSKYIYIIYILRIYVFTHET